MRIDYKVTLEEITTTNLLWLKGTGTFEKWRAYGVLYWLVVMGAIVYVGEGTLVVKILAGFILGGFLSFRMVFQPEVLLKKRIRKTIDKKLKNDLPMIATLELSKDEIAFQTESSKVTHNLSAFKSIDYEEEGILITFSNKDIIYVPNCAFADEAEKEKWEVELLSLHDENA